VSDSHASWLVDAAIGLLVAGVVAPTTLLLPPGLQGPWTLGGVAVCCVAIVYAVRHLLRDRGDSSQ
jgi:hypothetical protein